MQGAVLDAQFRRERARLVAGLARLTRDLDLAEEAFQEACLRAAEVWSVEGLPDAPGAWLSTVARRVAIDALRQRARVDDGADVSADEPPDGAVTPPSEEGPDARLGFLFACCHPALSAPAQMTLALKTVLGLTTHEIARAFSEPEQTCAQRLVRAKRLLRQHREQFAPPSSPSLEQFERVCAMVYLLFTEGHRATSGPSVVREALCEDALRLGRLLVELAPNSRAASGLLALMLLQSARAKTRTTEHGEVLRLHEQDRSRWDHQRIREGLTLLDETLKTHRAIRGPGEQADPYVIQAAIAALHCRAPTAAETDWPQIAALYGVLLTVRPSPIVELNAAIALAHAGNVRDALRWVNALEKRRVLRGQSALPFAKGDLLERVGAYAHAERCYRRARTLATLGGERQLLTRLIREVAQKPR